MFGLPVTTISTILLVMGVVGNAIVIIAVSTRKVLHTPTFSAIACLSVADLLCLCSRYVHTINDMHSVMGNQGWYMYSIVTFYFLHSANFHIVLLAYLRYAFLAKPLQSLNITTKSVLKMSGGVWLVGILVGSLYGFGTMYLEGYSTYLSFVFEITFGIYITFVPFLLIVVLHVLKIVKLRQMRYLSQEQPLSITSKMSAMLFILIVTYILSTIPVIVNMILHLVCFLIDFRVTQCQFFFSYYNISVTALFLLLNNALNPLIYFFFSPPSLIVYRRFTQCCKMS
jgi:hypothetical protein